MFSFIFIPIKSTSFLQSKSKLPVPLSDWEGGGGGRYNGKKKNILMVLYSVFSPKFTGRGFLLLLTYRNYSKKKEFRVSKLILLESFPVHYTVIECSFIYRETHFLGSVSKGVVLSIIKLCTEGSHLNSTLLILCKTEAY